MADEYFIGLKRDQQSGKWKWLSNSSILLAMSLPWATMEPQGDGNCAVMYKDYRRDYGKYNDLPCIGVKGSSGYICELPVDGCDQEGMSNDSNSEGFFPPFVQPFLCYRCLNG